MTRIQEVDDDVREESEERKEHEEEDEFGERKTMREQNSRQPSERETI